MRERLLGPEVYLDMCQIYVLNKYIDLRREAGSERGISFDQFSPLLSHHLRALDDEYNKDRAKSLEELKARHHQAPKPDRRPTRRH